MPKKDLDLKNITTFEQLKMAKHQFFQQNKQLQDLKKQLKSKSISLEQKKVIGNEIKTLLEQSEKVFNDKMQFLKNAEINQKIANEWIDINEPISSFSAFHPLTIVARRFRNFLIQNGFYEMKGKDIEEDKYNFEYLNVPKYHPARTMQASLYLNEQWLLRTHNTSYSMHGLEQNVNRAFSQFAIGNVYRNDEDDATHSHQFMQIDLISVGAVSVANFLHLLKSLFNYVFEKEIKMRVRPSYFPFTEPSIEIDIWHQNRWIEVLGGGMINHQVFEKAQYTNEMKAFACGIGIDRIAMIKYGISDIRELYRNDLRFLKQFKGVQ